MTLDAQLSSAKKEMERWFDEMQRLKKEEERAFGDAQVLKEECEMLKTLAAKSDKYPCYIF